jgi:hypothetical protein
MSYSDPRFSKTPHPHYKVVQPLDNMNNEGDVVGWWIFDPPDGCITAPRLDQLTMCGWLQVGVCFVLFWPCMLLPCFFSKNYEGYQMPIYKRRSYMAVPSAPEIPVAIPILE